MTELPQGTVTLLFTDIEGSTRLLQDLGESAYVRALEDHRRLVRETMTSRRGVEVEMQGDAFHFAFADARDAVLAAVEAQRALRDHRWADAPIRVRVGLHTGEPLVTGHLYAGLDVHRAARIMSAAHGGQVLVSEATYTLVRPDLPVDLVVSDLGEHRLKDLSAPQRIFQVGAGDFPPLASLYRTNLPVPVTPFVGRERELAEVCALLTGDEVRLVTLTGAGGSGKTRLAAQAAADVAHHYPDGVYWVGLAALRDPALVAPTIGHALGASDDLAEHLQAKRLLLLLDNFEQVVAAAPEVAVLLESCPRLAILATSREPLHLRAEREYTVLPLREPDAVALFHERTRAGGGVVADDERVAAICARVDFLPLAIELVAARAKVLSPAALQTRLAERLSLLTGGPRDAPERQRTLRATIDWSHGLLAPGEQRVFAEFAVFAGGSSLEAATAICEAALDELHALVDKGLLRRTDERFWMLETIREYASERLVELHGADEVRRRHARWFARLAHDAAEASRSDRASRWHQLLEADHDNVRAALEWALTTDDHDLGSAIAIDMSDYWLTKGHLPEGRGWLEAWVGHDDVPPERMALLLHEASSIAVRQGDDDDVEALGAALLELTTALGDDRGAVRALAKLAWTAVRRGDYARAAELQADASERARRSGDRRALLVALTSLGLFELRTGRVEEAGQAFAESLTLAQESAEKSEAHATAVFNLGLVDVVGGRPVEAARWLLEALGMYGELDDLEGVGYCLAAAASVAVAAGDASSASRLLGASAAMLETVGASLEPVEDELRATAEADARSRLTPADFLLAHSEGTALQPAEALALARTELGRLLG